MSDVKTSLQDLAQPEPGVPVLEAEPTTRDYPVKRLPGGWVAGTGRRKTSVARVRIKPGTGSFLVNGRPFDRFFCRPQDLLDVQAPLVATGTREKYDINVTVEGGGPTGQAGAIRLGLARALRGDNPAFDSALRGGRHLSRDSRMVERKKYGLHKARRAVQFSKR